MNMDWESILKNNELLWKIFGIFLIVSLFVVPGGMMLLLEKTNLFLNLSFVKMIFLSFLLSMPLIFSGMLLYVAGSINSDINNSNELPTSVKLFKSIIAIFIFSLMTVGFLYIAVRQDGFFFFFNKWFDGNIKYLYIANYIFSIILNALTISVSIAKVAYKEKNVNKGAHNV